MSNEYAAAGYIVELYQDIEALNGYVAQYKNIIIEIETRYSEPGKEKNIDLKKLDQSETKALLTIIPAIRILVINIQIKMNALGRRIKSFTELKNENFMEKFNSILNKPSPSFSDVYEISSIYNEVFVEGIIDNLLIQAQQIYQGSALYGAGKNFE